jgi:hypothetical protein
MGMDWRQELGPVVKRLPRYGRLGMRIYREPSLGPIPRGLLLAAVAYSVSPLDLIPGVLIGVGQLDDLLFMLLAIERSLRLIPVERVPALFRSVGLHPDNLRRDIQVVRKLAVFLGYQGGRLAWGALKGGGRLVWQTGRGTWRLGRNTWRWARKIRQR